VKAPSRPPTGVLVMAHGTPSDPTGIEPFYTSIRRGRPPTPELLAELVGRYEAIGGVSPLTERTRAQVEGLAGCLEAVAPGEYMVRYGAKHTAPSIEEGMAELVAAGVDRVVAIVLTPHQSSPGSGEYIRRAEEAAALAPRPVTLVPVASWHRAPGLATLLAERTEEAMASIDAGARTRTAVFFTAHSLPLRVVAEGDPYPAQVGESASDIAGLLGLDGAPGVTWGVAWQSAGRTPDPWMGPDLLAEMGRVAAEGATSVVVCPVGFVSDHLEILFDLDIEATDVARSAGVAFARTRSLDDDPRFLGILAGVVQNAAAHGTTQEAPPGDGSSEEAPGSAAVATGPAPIA
jgi:protoporphyrin/coproporphyrin ferrochelatase